MVKYNKAFGISSIRTCMSTGNKCECANCGSVWKMIETNDVGGPNVCPVCMVDDWSKSHHYE